MSKCHDSSKSSTKPFRQNYGIILLKRKLPELEYYSLKNDTSNEIQEKLSTPPTRDLSLLRNYLLKPAAGLQHKSFYSFKVVSLLSNFYDVQANSKIENKKKLAKI